VFQLNLISKEAVEKFFEQNDIPLHGNKRLDKNSLNTITLSASKLSKVFGLFVTTAMLNEDSTMVETNFDSVDEAYDMYENFLAGYSRSGVES
jgi:hypothetical protein